MCDFDKIPFEEIIFILGLIRIEKKQLNPELPWLPLQKTQMDSIWPTSSYGGTFTSYFLFLLWDGLYAALADT